MSPTGLRQKTIPGSSIQWILIQDHPRAPIPFRQAIEVRLEANVLQRNWDARQMMQHVWRFPGVDKWPYA